MKSMQYFSRFGDDNAFKNIAYHTKLHSMEQTVKLIDEANEKKFEVFSSIVQMKMAIIKIPQYKM